MTTYATPENYLTIFFGPGAVDLYGNGRVTGWLSADVGVRLAYSSHAPEGATRAVIELIAEQVEPGTGHDEIHIEAELTEGDLQVLAGTIDALLVAIKEDDRRERDAERRGERVGD